VEFVNDEVSEMELQNFLFLNFKVLINFQTDLFQTGLFLKLESMTGLFLNL
jgi:hypothetical protein